MNSRDELRSEREDTAVSEGSVVWRRPRVVLVDGRLDPSLVSGLGGEDRSSGPMNTSVTFEGAETLVATHVR